MVAVHATCAGEGTSAPDSHPKGQAQVFAPRDARYTLRVGDVVEISFRFTPEFDQTVTVQPDGYINLRELPDLNVGGKTTVELAAAVRKAYAHILRDPAVSVHLKEFERPYFVAGGELGKPGKYELRGDTSLTEAIQIAGGFNEKSKHSQVLLFRRVPDGWSEVKRLDVKAMLKSGNLAEDMRLRPGDLIYVPKNALSKFERFIPNTSMGIYANPAR